MTLPDRETLETILIGLNTLINFMLTHVVRRSNRRGPR